jgi:hypothetical protein
VSRNLRWRAQNQDHYRAYMRDLMRERWLGEPIGCGLVH